MPTLPVRLLATVLGLVTAGVAQTTWIVGTGGYAQIRDVMPFVTAGDTVLVGPGTYFPFGCNRGITIRAVTPGTVTVLFNFFGIPQPCGCTCLGFQGRVPFTIPAGETAHVVGLTFAGYYSGATPCGTLVIQQRVLVTSGRVTFDTCTIDRLVVQNAAAHLQDCTITSVFNGPGLDAASADVTVVGGTISGANAGVTSASAVAGQGIVALDCQLHVAGATVTGGAAAAALQGAPGITTVGGSLWLSDATVTAGGGCAVDATGPVRIDRSTLSGTGGCAASPTGAPLVGIDRSGPIEIGQLFQVTVTSEPGALALVYGSIKLGPALLAPIVEQPIWIDPTLLFLSDVAIAGPTGHTTFAYQVPPIPALIGEQFWLQGFGGTSFPLQTSPPVGGIVR